MSSFSRIELPQGTLDLLILRTLALGPQHGWAISQRIQQISAEVLQVPQGSLYRHFIDWSVATGFAVLGTSPITTERPNTTGSRPQEGSSLRRRPTSGGNS